jgi:omega-amidase
LATHPLRIALAQLPMQWTIEANMALILDAITLAHGRGAQLASFAELAITGIHRQIGQLAKPELIKPCIDTLQTTCRHLGIAAAVGAPTFDEQGHKFITHFLIDERGAVAAQVHKIGLTEPEATFFRPGSGRAVGVLQGQRCSAVICREVGDLAPVREQLPPGSTDLVFLPGALRQDPEKPVADPPAYIQDAQALARALQAHVIHSNWPNALNRPEETALCGFSAVLAPDGELLIRLPRHVSGVALFALGARDFEWHALAQR